MLTCIINTQSTSPLNTKEQLVAYTKAQLLQILISYSTDNTLDCLSDWHVLTSRLAKVYRKSQEYFCKIFKGGTHTLVSTQPLLRTSGQPLGNLCRKGGDKRQCKCYKIITWDYTSFHYSIHVSSVRNDLKKTRPKGQ